MNFKDIVKPKPLILTLLPTHKCTASCEGCCFGCTPKIKHRMTLDEMKQLVDSSLETFPTIRLLVLSGGECTLLGDDLYEIIAYGSGKGLLTRVVSNAHWAKSYDAAYGKMSKLINSGLNELNISTGIQHQKFVPLDYVANAVYAATNLGINPVQIALEKHGQIENYNNLCENDILSQLIQEGKVQVLEGEWQNFKGNNLKSVKTTHSLAVKTNQLKCRCKNLYNSITINPYYQLLACCGITNEYNRYIKLGSLKNDSIKNLYDTQFEDLFFLWLYTMGAEYIYNEIARYKNIKPNVYSHPCVYCMEIIRDKDNIPIMEKLVKRDLAQILFNLQLINSNLNL